MTKAVRGRGATAKPRTRWMKKVEEHQVIVGRNLRTARTEAGLTLEQAHEKTGLNYSYLSRLERGLENVSLSTLVRLGTAYGVSVRSLVP